VRLSRPAWLFCAILLRLSFLNGLWGQVGTATVTGEVEDSTRARIPAASITLINTLTGAENRSTTDRYGHFAVTGVLPGNYLLQVEREGFATLQFMGMNLNLGDTKNVLVRMRLGTISQTVHVDGAGLTLDVNDASLSTVVNQKFVSNVPLNGRSFQDLIAMTPGAETQSPQNPGQGDFSVNGQRTDTNSYTVDGVSGNIGPGSLTDFQKLPSMGRYAGTTAIGTTQSLVSLEALQEFRVFSSNYSVEYGHTPAANSRC